MNPLGEIYIFPDIPSLEVATAEWILSRALAAIHERGRFFLALSGGSTPLGLYARLARAPFRDAVDWSKTRVFLGDERCVPFEDPSRNERRLRRALLDHVPCQIPFASSDLTSVNPHFRYEKRLRAAFDFSADFPPRFDLILLGMGADGHTASLFPGDSSLEEEHRLVAYTEHAPVPPEKRVSFTLPLINAARAVLFLVSGEKKRTALQRACRGDRSIPAGRVRPDDGRLRWHVDAPAWRGSGTDHG